jgi:hypothetical protein|tara:strand:+ start:1915 stop:2172 length:258 start_codon:yes stop_codon:yes gene_type:complete
MEKNSLEHSDLSQFRAVLPKVSKLELGLATHEVQCEERWKTCFQRLTDVESGLHRIESRMTVMGGTVIMFLAGVLVTLISQGGNI